MTDQASTEEPCPNLHTEESWWGKRRRALLMLRGMLEHADPGVLARLRRMAPEQPPAEFFRFSVAALDDVLPQSGRWRHEQESRWAAIVKLMAIALGTNPRAGGLLSDEPLGKALALAGVSEMRVLRLLDAGDAQLVEHSRHVVHQLVSKGRAFRIDDFADLLLSSGEIAENARREIASSYYRHQDDAQKRRPE